jgi:hypothetical protein
MAKGGSSSSRPGVSRETSSADGGADGEASAAAGGDPETAESGETEDVPATATPGAGGAELGASEAGDGDTGTEADPDAPDGDPVRGAGAGRETSDSTWGPPLTGLPYTDPLLDAGPYPLPTRGCGTPCSP